MCVCARSHVLSHAQSYAGRSHSNATGPYVHDTARVRQTKLCVFIDLGRSFRPNGRADDACYRKANYTAAGGTTSSIHVTKRAFRLHRRAGYWKLNFVVRRVSTMTQDRTTTRRRTRSFRRARRRVRRLQVFV